MATLNFDGKEYTCSRAQKGTDFIRLLDGNGNIVFFADGISDFSGYELVDGSWENPIAVTTPTISVHASLINSLIVLDVPAFVKVETGLPITFSAPCNCDAVTGVSINGVAYTLVDAMGNAIADLNGGAFCLGAIVSIIIDVANAKAYIQNAASALSSTNQQTATNVACRKNGNVIAITRTLADGSIVEGTLVLDSATDLPVKYTEGDLECSFEFTGF